MIMWIVCLIFACLGIYGFNNEIYVLTYIGFGFSLFEQLYGIYSGQSKTFFPTILAGAIGFAIVGQFWLGIAIGLCYENLIFSIGSVILLLFAAIFSGIAKIIEKVKNKK